MEAGSQYTKLQKPDAAELRGNELPERLRQQNSRDFQGCQCKISRLKGVFAVEVVAGRTRKWLTRGYDVRIRPATAKGAGNATEDTVRRSDPLVSRLMKVDGRPANVVKSFVS
jgi:hypothetical protein